MMESSIKMYTQSSLVKDIMNGFKALELKRNEINGNNKKTEIIKKTIIEILEKYKKISIWTSGIMENNEENQEKEVQISGHEWLYDLVAYRYHEKEHYSLNYTILTMESEWGGKRKYKTQNNDGEDCYGEVKYDFQKLLVSNADIKLMVYQRHRTKNRNDDDDNDNILNYFKERVDEYAQISKRSVFIFVQLSYWKKGICNCKVCSYRKNGKWRVE